MRTRCYCQPDIVLTYIPCSRSLSFYASYREVVDVLSEPPAAVKVNVERELVSVMVLVVEEKKLVMVGWMIIVMVSQGIPKSDVSQFQIVGLTDVHTSR